jgi:glycosyltransferase involved in cell wall biosynthesis
MYNVIKIILNSGRVFASWLQLRINLPTWRRPLRARVPHLFLFAWGFPPMNRIGVYRPTSLAKYAANNGWNVTVIAGPLEDEPAEGFELLRSLPSNVRIFRADPEPTVSYRLLPKINGGFSNIIMGFRAAQLACHDDSPTVVMATGPDFMTFISAYFVAKKLGVPLVLDYRDEWTIHTPHFVNVSAFDKKWELRLIKFASALIFVTEPIRDLYLAAINSLNSNKCFVVSNGWDPEDFQQVSKSERGHLTENREKLVVSFVGTSGPHSDPSAFLERFEEVVSRRPSFRDRFVFRFVGRRRKAQDEVLMRFRARYPNSIELLDEIPKSAAIAEMCRADALLLLMDPFTATVATSGKLFEYVATGMPILVVSEEGPASCLVREIDAGIVVSPSDSYSLEGALNQLLHEPRERWATPQRSAWLVNHTRAALASRTLDILAKL